MSFFRRHPNISRTVFAMFTGLFLLMELGAPLAVYAIPVEVVGTPYEDAKEQVKNVKETLDQTLLLAALRGILNAMQVAAQRLAYDSAQVILAGGPGKSPLFHNKSFGDYLVSVAENQRDIFIDTINKDVANKAGFDFCTPVDPLAFSLAFKAGSVDQLQAKCTLAKIGKAWDDTKTAFKTTRENFDAIQATLDSDSSDIGVGFEAHNEMIKSIGLATDDAKLQRVETGGMKPIRDPVSGDISTPAKVFDNSLKELDTVKMQRDEEFEMRAAIIGNAWWMGAKQLGALSVATFGQALASGLMQKIVDGLKPGIPGDQANVDLVNADAISNQNEANARVVFSDLLTPNLISGDVQDFVTELSACPTPRGIWNCSMDDAMAAALKTVGESGAYTVGRAAQVVLNGKPPSNPAFLHKDWELIPDSDSKENADPTCYQRGYCAVNLAKLRFARILPVGWELAANSPANKKFNGKYVTLEQVIRGFNVCNTSGELDTSHPWCHLIDPNWVLAAPPFQCHVKGFSDTVIGGSSERLEDCADAISCLKRNDQGECTSGYGYCLAEKPVWRFSADACLERFASCRTYNSRQGQQVSYLRNTIDYGKCSADSVGCLWYSTRRDPASSDESWLGNSSSGPRLYVDASIKPCSVANDGCTRVMQVEVNKSALNLVPNSSFEQSTKTGDAKTLNYWNLVNAAQIQQVFSLTDTGVFQGNYSLSLGEKKPNEKTVSYSSPGILMSPLRNYTLSFYAKPGAQNIPATVGVRLFLYQADAFGKVTGVVKADKTFFRGEGCKAAPNEGDKDRVGYVGPVVSSDDPVTWQRFECSFVSNDDAGAGFLGLEGSNVIVDALQLEEAQRATDPIDGLSVDLVDTHLKLPPDEFGCKGTKDDPAACSRYAKMCKQTDVGCQGYRDLNDTGAPEIPATLSAIDACPASCIGYAEYRKQPSAFDLGKSTNDLLNDPEDDTSATFVPSTANQCSLQDIGCEEFTNLESAQQGGEEKASFNYVRACEKPGKDTETYFTWEGSDTTGYQLRTWSLIHDASVQPAAPKLVLKAGLDSVLKDSASCNANTWQQQLDADCRQFFNANGNPFYVFFSQTVLSSPECKNFRKSNTNIADCVKTGGSFIATSGECIYAILQKESRSCNAEAVGCRAYIGVTGRNTSLVLNEDFKGTATTTSKFTSGQLSNEAILVGDKSLKVTTDKTQTTFESYSNLLYSVSFWAKSTAIGNAKATLKVDGQSVGTFKIAPDWARYEFGPFGTSSTAPTSTLAWENLSGFTFLDEIRVVRLQDVNYVVKDSWATPNECDMTPEGLPQPQAMLGCRAYQDRDQKLFSLRRFGHLCSEEAIACKAYIDTRNSADPYGQTFVTKGTAKNSKLDGQGKPLEPAFSYQDKYVGNATTTRVADRYVYVIDQPASHCDKTQASCRAFGKPQYAADYVSLGAGSSSFETVYLIDDITQYVDQNGEPNMLCRKNELFCEEFKSGKTVAYFRNPDKHTCEWKDKVLLKKDLAKGIPEDAEYSGWFQTGQDVPCYKDFMSSGNTYLIQNAGDASYLGWYGTCPVEQSECSEFRDPNDHSDPLHVTGKPYFFIKNNHLDLKSCAGKIDLLSGCVLFKDATDPRQLYSVSATYNKSHDEDDTPQSPIDCVTDPDNKYCQKNKICQNMKMVSCKGNGCKLKSELDPISAVADEECSPLGQKQQTPRCQKILKVQAWSGPDALDKMQGMSCKTDDDCTLDGFEDDAVPPSGFDVEGTCKPDNNANTIIKVKLDRDCSQWLGCSSGETVYDPAQQKYVDVCMDVGVCNAAKGTSGASYCASYVNRTVDPVLKPGLLFNQNVYTKRAVGFGEIDYSGYSIPDQFQAADIKNQRVAFDLFSKSPLVKNKFALDYRLTAAVPESTDLIEFPDGKPKNIFDPLYPDLMICRHKQTGRTGFFVDGTTKGKRVCYFAVDSLSTRSPEALQQGQQKDGVDPRNIQPLADEFRQSKDPANDTILQRAFPPAECKGYPEADSPFPNLYVKEWDQTKEPPRAVSRADGYGAANVCEFGEDCACSYRKVKYGGSETRYYSPFGVAPAGGLCSGGLNDGQACVPSAQKKDEGQSAGTTNQQQTQDGDIGCPGGGRCLAMTDVILVRGQYGQCLQRDYSRTVAGDQGRHPCLVWSPNPILSGSYDTYHYTPSAGYLPPVNSGEYYCLSYASPPFETVWTAESHTQWDNSQIRQDADKNDMGTNGIFHLPGKLSKFNYDRAYIAGRCSDLSDMCGDGESDCNCHDGLSNNKVTPPADVDEIIRQNKCMTIAEGLDPKGTCDTFLHEPSVFGPGDPLIGNMEDKYRFQNLGVGIDGYGPSTDDEGWQATWCSESASADKDDHSSPHDPEVNIPGVGPYEKSADVNYDLGRWIQTGRGISKTYMEYFFAASPLGVAKWLYPNATADELKDPTFLGAAMDEANFARFQFYATNDKYLSACRLPKWYVDGVEIDDFTDRQKVFNASNAIFSAFQKDFDGNLDRSKEGIVTANDKPVKEKCSGLNDGGAPPTYAGDDGRCYLKYWETDYRMDGTAKFNWLDVESGNSFWDRHTRYYNHERTCSKSGFAIRAMFENTNKNQNNRSAEDLASNQLTGPWRFTGFWITACTAGTDKESFLYLGLKVKHADVCRDLAQVISPYSRESVAFADRVWNNGSFAVPQLGFNYNSNYTPFGSALVSGRPGIEPLFQTGQPAENFSKLHPPTFLGSGQTYFSLKDSPIYRWAHLSNLFARVYRVYRYVDAAVGKNDSACTDGPNKGSLCPTQNGSPELQKEADEICGGKGVCDPGATSQALKDSVFKCNGLSGLNAGLDCGASFAQPALDPTCHNAAMKNVNGVMVPQLVACKLRPGWKQCKILGMYNKTNQGENSCLSAGLVHQQFNAFGCDTGAIVPGAGCSEPSAQSKDCPKLIPKGQVTCIKDDFGAMAGHCSNGYEHSRCATDDDCVFTKAQWWGAYDDGKPQSTDPNNTTLQEISVNFGGDLFKLTDEEKQKFPPALMAPYYNPNGAPPLFDNNKQRLVQYALPFASNGTAIAAVASDMSNFAHLKPNQISATKANTMAFFARMGGHVELSSTNYLAARWPSPHISVGTPVLGCDAVGEDCFGKNMKIVDYIKSLQTTFVMPGLCEGAYGTHADPNKYVAGFYKSAADAIYKYFPRPQYALQAGTCKGGVYGGQLCFSRTDAKDQAGATWKNHACIPPNAVDDAFGLCKLVTNLATGKPAPGCEGSDSNETDLDGDDNSCTHNAGYEPRIDLCAGQADNEKCLTGYVLGDNAPDQNGITNTQRSLNQSLSRSPTDVTSGFHTPVFLGLKDASAYDYLYMAHYAPRPPTIAAPDLSHTCATPGSCPISAVGSFSVEDQSAGDLQFAGGKAQVALRFYAWAGLEQSPLKALYVDWGDGTISRIENARMKNKKPFCDTAKECELISGLTCGSDADCPPGGGKCTERGTCAQNPSRVCKNSLECQQYSGSKDDKCQPRTFFGSSGDACEANYFEFTHAYSCNLSNKLEGCRDQADPEKDIKRCSRNTGVKCNSPAECGTGDECVGGLGPPSNTDGTVGGCCDKVKATCRFTPRVMVKDNWNWCTGECRAGGKAGNDLTDGPLTKVKHIYGGCWDGTETYPNIVQNQPQPIMGDQSNECFLGTTSKFVRPWITYQGAVNVGVVQ